MTRGWAISFRWKENEQMLTSNQAQIAEALPLMGDRD